MRQLELDKTSILNHRILHPTSVFLAQHKGMRLVEPISKA